jgi:hypothetical protein
MAGDQGQVDEVIKAEGRKQKEESIKNSIS